MNGPFSGDGWVSYFVVIDEVLSSVAFDASLGARAPVTSYVVLARLTFPVIGDDDFFFTAEEGEGLARVVTRLEKAAGRPPGLLGRLGLGWRPPIVAGRVSRRGQCQVFVYLTHTLSRALLAEVERAVPGVSWDADQGADARWSFYRERLHPGDALAPILAGRARLESRAGVGDELAAAREVVHTLRFPDEVGRAAFLEEVRATGDAAVRTFEAEDGDRRFGAAVTIEHELTRAVLEPYVLGLETRGRNRGGVYDGWDADVVRRAGFPDRSPRA